MNIIPTRRVTGARWATLPVTLAVTLAATLAAPARAQDVIKPTRTATTLGRLPAPAKITAVQQTDGRIRVAWSAVDGAARYSLYRSVPNYGQGNVALSNPMDTGYVDSDVKVGLYYYYVVHAIDAGGGAGLNISAVPVLSSKTVTATTATGGTAGAVAAPSEVKASLAYPHANIFYRSTQGGVRYQVERGVVSGGAAAVASGGTGTTFTLLETKACCSSFDFNVATAHPVGTRIVYRITAVDSVTPTLRSAPVLTNEIVTYKLEATVGGSRQVYPQPPSDMTPMLGMYGGTPQSDWTNRHIVSLDPTIAAVTAEGGVLGRALGATYIVIGGTRADGVMQTILYRIDVVPRP